MDKAKFPTSGSSQELRCHLCSSSTPTITCDGCSRLSFCVSCDSKFHSHPRRQHHTRIRIGLDYQDRNCSPRLARQASPSVVSSKSDNAYVTDTMSPKSTALFQPILSPKLNYRNSPEAEFSTNDGTWVCEHCTFVNSSIRRICEICCKTHGLGLPIVEQQRATERHAETGNKVEQSKVVEKTKLPQSSLPQITSPKLILKNKPKDGTHTRNDKKKMKDTENANENLSHDRALTRSRVSALVHTFEHQTEKHNNPKEIGKLPKNGTLKFDKLTSETNTEVVNGNALSTSSSLTLAQERQDGEHNVESGKVNQNAKSNSNETKLDNWLKEAKKCGFSSADLEVAVNLCGPKNPVQWLRDHWQELVVEVIQLGNSCGYEGRIKPGIISVTEAKKALHKHYGDRNEAAKECVDHRRKGIVSLQKRGKFPSDKILEALFVNDGNVEDAYLMLVRNFKI